MTDLSPLSQRVSAPAEVRRPADADGIVWRASTADDIDALLDCQRAAALVDHPHYMPTRDELEEDFDVSHIDPATDTIQAMDATGQVLARGIAFKMPTADTIVRVITDGVVRPSHRGRGLGTQLRTWLDARGLQQLASSGEPLPGWLMTYAADEVTDAKSLLERTDYRIARYFLELRRDLAQPIEPRPVDLEVVNFGRGLSEPTRLASNDAFRDHWGSQPQNEEVWGKHTEKSTSRDDLSFVALAPDGEVAGYALTSVSPDDWPGQGFTSAYVDLVGTRRAWRGKGIAPALLTRVMLAAKAEGLEKVVLDVDAENPSGALGLYTKLGFEPAHTTVTYVREF